MSFSEQRNGFQWETNTIPKEQEDPHTSAKSPSERKPGHFLSSELEKACKLFFRSPLSVYGFYYSFLCCEKLVNSPSVPCARRYALQGSSAADEAAAAIATAEIQNDDAVLTKMQMVMVLMATLLKSTRTEIITMISA